MPFFAFRGAIPWSRFALSKWVLLALCAGTFAGAPRKAEAQVAATTTEARVSARELSAYEHQSITLAAGSDAKIDDAPEGKIIERVDVVRLDVFEDRDPAPNLLNLFHATTREGVVRQRLLLHVGDAYSQYKSDETARQLRILPQLSVVLVVPLIGSGPNRVRLLVVTKDVWSLRIGWEPTFADGKFTSLALQPSESNLFGTTQAVLATLRLDPQQVRFGLAYQVPRMAGTHIGAAVFGNAAVNCATGDLEGGDVGLSYGRPLTSRDDRWSWGAEAYYAADTTRRSKGDPGLCSSPKSRNATVELRDSPIAGTSTFVAVPDENRFQSVRAQARLTRSFLKQDKIDVSIGAEIEHFRRSALPLDGRTLMQRLSSEQQIEEASLENIARALAQRNTELGSSHDTRIGPFAQLHAYSTRFLSTLNYYTLGLQEDVLIGHDVYLKLYPSLRPLSTRTFLGTFAGASYTSAWGDGFVRAAVSGKFELAASGQEDDPEIKSAAQMSRSSIAIGAHLATPQNTLGRLVSNLRVLKAPRTIYVRDTQIGGNLYLRGYPAGEFTGRDLIAWNTEFRTRPIEIYSVLAGLAFFWDMADVPSSLSKLELAKMKHGAGVGLRLLFPQLDRDVFRVDFAIPVNQHTSPLREFRITAGFRQLFGAPGIRPDPVIPQ